MKRLYFFTITVFACFVTSSCIGASDENDDYYSEEAIKQLQNALCAIKVNFIQIYFDDDGSLDNSNIVRFLVEDCNRIPIELDTFTFENQKRPPRMTKFPSEPHYLPNHRGGHFFFKTREALFDSQRSSSKLSLTLIILKKSNDKYLDGVIDWIHNFTPVQEFAEQFHKLFVMVLEELNDKQWLNRFFTKVWRKRIFNVVFAVWRPHSAEAMLQMWTYVALNQERVNESSVPVTSRLTEADMFPNKITQLNGERIRVSMELDEIRAYKIGNSSRYYGTDGELAELMREKLNATFEYIEETPETEMHENLKTRRAAISFNAQSRFSVFEESVGMTNSFNRRDICVLVPNSDDDPVYFNLLLTFSGWSWVMLISSILLTPVVFLAVQETRHRFIAPAGSHNRRRIKDIFLMFYQSFFGDTIEQMPSSLVLRIIIISWSLYSLMMTTAFSGKLISSLVQPNRQPHIDSIDALIKENLTLYSTNSTMFGIRSEVKHMQELPREIKEACKNGSVSGQTCHDYRVQIAKINSRISNLNETIHRLKFIKTSDFLTFIGNNTNQTRYAYVMSRYIARKMIRKHFNKVKGRSNFHLMHECLLHLPLVYYVERGMPYLARINELLSLFRETGFSDYWERDSNTNGTFSDLNDLDESEEGEDGGSDEDSDEKVTDKAKDDEEQTKIVITMEHLASAFWLWAFGVSASFVAFLVEWGRVFIVAREIKT